MFKLFKIIFIVLLLNIGFYQITLGAYRAYYMQVFDKVFNTSITVITGFSPKNYLSSIRKDSNVTVLVKASWMCGGDTSFKRVCPMPKPIDSKFQIGQKVKVNLAKHVTSDWVGTVEVALWRDDLKSNIYGLRFEEKNFLYGNYYEKDLLPIKDENLVADNLEIDINQIQAAISDPQ